MQVLGVVRLCSVQDCTFSSSLLHSHSHCPLALLPSSIPLPPPSPSLLLPPPPSPSLPPPPCQHGEDHNLPFQIVGTILYSKSILSPAVPQERNTERGGGQGEGGWGEGGGGGEGRGRGKRMGYISLLSVI